MPIVSSNTQARDEGYFRREWSLGAERTRDMADEKAFLVPVVIDETSERRASVPDRFRLVQWTRLPEGEPSPAFVERVAGLLGIERPTEGSARATLATASPLRPVAPRPHALRTWLGIGAVIIVVTGGWLLWRYSGKPATPTTLVAAEKSIAVLPFVDMSERHDQEYFGDGMAEEILSLLAQIPNLKVIGRTSSFKFKGKTDDLRLVGSTLGATYVVEGSVRRAGDRMRVTAQLIDAVSGAHRWSETYDREASDVLEVQREIAQNISSELRLEVARHTAKSSRRSVMSPAAYDLYLRGLHAKNRYDQRGLEEAIVDFNRALEVDPTFVSAAEDLADAKVSIAAFGLVPPISGYADARVAVGAVLKLDSRSATAHALLASIHIWNDWDWKAAEEELNIAAALEPTNPDFMRLAEGRLLKGEWRDAIRFCERSLALDPLSPSVYETLGWAQLRLGQYSEAEASHRRLVELSPTYSFGYFELAETLLLQGKLEQALVEVSKERNPAARLAGMAIAMMALKRKRESDDYLASLVQSYSRDAAYLIAGVHAFRGEKNEAFAWLTTAFEQRDVWLTGIKGDPLLKSLTGEARLTEFLRKMNLPQ